MTLLYLAGSNLGITTFHNSNDNLMFNPLTFFLHGNCNLHFSGLDKYTWRVAKLLVMAFCILTTLLTHLLKYLVIQYSFIYCQLYLENESDLPVSFSFFAEYTNVSTNYEKTILTFHDSLSFPIALARPGIIHFACRKENVSYIKKV